MKKTTQSNPELTYTKVKIKLSIMGIKKQLDKIPKYIESESEGYMSQLTRWAIEDIEQLKQEIKRYHILKKQL
jgi:predicted ATP-dependent Lon-type protease